jgi:predicted DNA-binding transcriptional regulator AlpA
MQLDTTASLLTEKDLAKYLRVSAITLRKWRWKNEGPKFLKLGSSVRYHPDDVAAYLATLRN